MVERTKEKLKQRLSEENWQKLSRINNRELYRFIHDYLELCNPQRIFVCNDSAEDLAYIREETLEQGEEIALVTPGHTVHFDGEHDQGRDKENTRYLIAPGMLYSPLLNTLPREEGYQVVSRILKNIMQDRQLFILFFCLGPTHSPFSQLAVQLTDSSYVAHSEMLLYRPGYEEFVQQGAKAHFYKFVHSAGELTPRRVSKNVGHRRVYIDLRDEIVFSMNTQYAGNTVGLKKLALRLAIHRAAEEGWLAEHMFIMGVHGPGQRKSYFLGAYPSMCGKTSTAMLEGETVVGDDIAYLRRIDGEIRAVNIEKGIFGIIQGINSKDDRILWKTLHSPGEIIFSNVLVTLSSRVCWTGKDEPLPSRGINYSGEWVPGKITDEGFEVPPSHPNARFTMELKNLENVDPALDEPQGVPVQGIIYGGRDSEIGVPVEEAFDWTHGVITKGASLESETTAATLGQVGLRRFNPMANLDFLSVPLPIYIENYLQFAEGIADPPRIFSVNYFLRDRQGNFLNEIKDKLIWLKWIERRAHDEVRALKRPTGLIPLYEDLKQLFKEYLDKDYTEESYVEQFTLRIPENLAKIERLLRIYRFKLIRPPAFIIGVLGEQRQRLLGAQSKFGNYIAPDKWEET